MLIERGIAMKDKEKGPKALSDDFLDNIYAGVESHFQWETGDNYQTNSRTDIVCKIGRIPDQSGKCDAFELREIYKGTPGAKSCIRCKHSEVEMIPLPTFF